MTIFDKQKINNFAANLYYTCISLYTWFILIQLEFDVDYARFRIKAAL